MVIWLPRPTVHFGLPIFLPKVFRPIISQERGPKPSESETAKILWTYSTSTFSPLAAGLKVTLLVVTFSSMQYRNVENVQIR